MTPAITAFAALPGRGMARDRRVGWALVPGEKPEARFRSTTEPLSPVCLPRARRV
jgi:hypothetical protein